MPPVFPHWPRRTESPAPATIAGGPQSDWIRREEGRSAPAPWPPMAPAPLAASVAPARALPAGHWFQPARAPGPAPSLRAESAPPPAAGSGRSTPPWLSAPAVSSAAPRSGRAGEPAPRAPPPLLAVPEPKPAPLAPAQQPGAGHVRRSPLSAAAAGSTASPRGSPAPLPAEAWCALYPPPSAPPPAPGNASTRCSAADPESSPAPPRGKTSKPPAKAETTAAARGVIQTAAPYILPLRSAPGARHG